MPELPLIPDGMASGRSASDSRVSEMTPQAATLDPIRRKELGAFYTPPAMAQKLVDWAVRSEGDRVLDPSFGGMVFLRAAQQRLLSLGANNLDIRFQLHGLDVDPAAHQNALDGDSLGIDGENLLLGDFFAIEPDRHLPRCQAVVGNPPYVRYQDFNQSSTAAHRITAAGGVRMTRLASSWAPFLVHATDFVAPGGRMAQVLPAELLHAQYAGEVMEFLRRRFARVTIAVFEERVFPGALEEVVLLFADGRGEGRAGEIQLLSCATLDELDLAGMSRRADVGDEIGDVAPAREKLLVQLLPREVQSLYRSLVAEESVERLGELADVGIGAVTGANDFFLLAANETEELAQELLRPAVSKATHVRGARFCPEDFRTLAAAGRKMEMFVADSTTPGELIATAGSYIERGRQAGFHERYKCRVRDPWWAVPIPKMGTPDLLLTYCANQFPRLVLNEARVIQTNTIHGVRLKDPAGAPSLAASFYNSLTLLSAELVGRSYGGGVLKLEPTEAEALAIPPRPLGAADTLESVDELVRAGNIENLMGEVDRLVLSEGLGLSEPEISALRSGGERLRARRKARGKRPSA